MDSKGAKLARTQQSVGFPWARENPGPPIRPIQGHWTRGRGGARRKAYGQHAGARCKAECEARVVREAWRQAWAGGPSQESKAIAGQWVLKGGGLIQVDQDDAADSERPMRQGAWAEAQERAARAQGAAGAEASPGKAERGSEAREG